MVEGLTDAKLRKLRRGGHDPEKVYAAYTAAVEHRGSPTVILAKTIKGYGLGEAGEGRNVTHQQKKLNEKELRSFRDRFGIPIGDRELLETPFYRPPDDSEEMQYLLERRRALGGFVPRRVRAGAALARVRRRSSSTSSCRASGEREVATTMVLVRLLRHLMNDPEIGRLIVPIVPDEARTFGMDALFRKFGIYSSAGQQYEPVDSDVVAYYREAKDGQLLEEGITEAGAMASFTAAGTAYATHGVNTIPFFFFYSMFGFQRIGDLIWQNADARGHGFLIGATAGRTTLAGEGLQHQDGHSHVLASVVPTVRAYDPAFAYEIAGDRRDGIRRMYVEREDVLLLPHRAERDVHDAGDARGRRGGHPARPVQAARPPRGRFVAARPSLRQRRDPARGAARAGAARRARVAADVWSVTSYTELRRDALAVERWNMLHPHGAAAHAVRQPRARRRAVARRRRERLHEDRRRSDGALRARDVPIRSAPTASAAATTARRCAASSRSTPNRSPSPRSPSWRGAAVSIAPARRRGDRDFGIDPERADPARS